jgi:hypothetical protein
VPLKYGLRTSRYLPWPFKKRRMKGKVKLLLTVMSAMEQHPQHFVWHHTALLKAQVGVHNKSYLQIAASTPTQSR